ncbi:MAG: hypothetical protein ACT4NL_14715 [Pseudomarimonas sp.]
MIIWKGGGIAVPVVVAGWLLLGQWSVESALGEGYWSANAWPKLLAAVGMAGSLWWLGRQLNRSKGATLIDPDSGLEFVYRSPAHSFFYVPVEWTGPVIGVLLIALVVIIR